MMTSNYSERVALRPEHRKARITVRQGNNGIRIIILETAAIELCAVVSSFSSCWNLVLHSFLQREVLRLVGLERLEAPTHPETLLRHPRQSRSVVVST